MSEHFVAHFIIVGNQLLDVVGVLLVVLAYEGLRFLVKNIF